LSGSALGGVVSRGYSLDGALTAAERDLLAAILPVVVGQAVSLSPNVLLLPAEAAAAIDRVIRGDAGRLLGRLAVARWENPSAPGIAEAVTVLGEAGFTLATGLQADRLLRPDFLDTMITSAGSSALPAELRAAEAQAGDRFRLVRTGHRIAY